MHRNLILFLSFMLSTGLHSFHKKMLPVEPQQMRQDQQLVNSYGLPSKPFLRIDPMRYEFILSGDYLFQRPYRRGMDFAVNTFPTGPAAQLPNGSTFDVSYSFTNGYEINIGLKTPNRWCFELLYNRFHTKSKRNIAQTPQTLVATRGLAGTIGAQGAYDQAKAEARLDWDIYTLEFARDLSVGDLGSFKPHIGIRWSYIDQDFKTLYVRSVATSSVDRIEEQTDSSLIGAIIGASGMFPFVEYFGIEGSLDIAFMRADQRLSNVQFNNDTQEVDYRELFIQIIPAVETSLGFFAKWEYFVITLGYHFKYWAGAAFSARSDVDDSRLGQFIPVEYDLSLSGLNMGIQIAF